MKNIRPETIIKIVYDYYKTTEKKVGTRKLQISILPKQMAMKLVMKYCKVPRGYDTYVPITLKECGSYFPTWKRDFSDHTPVMHNIAKIEGYVEYDRQIKIDYEDLCNKIEIITSDDLHFLYKEREFLMDKMDLVQGKINEIELV